MPESSLCGLRGECGFLPCREAPGLFSVGALIGSLCFRYGSYMIWKELGGFSKEAVVPLGLYAGQLALNWAWPPLFFGTRQMGWVSVALACLPGPWRWPLPGGDMRYHIPAPQGQDLKVGSRGGTWLLVHSEALSGGGGGGWCGYFPGGAVARFRAPNAGGPGFDPRSGNLIPPAATKPNAAK